MALGSRMGPKNMRRDLILGDEIGVSFNYLDYPMIRRWYTYVPQGIAIVSIYYVDRPIITIPPICNVYWSEYK